MRDRTGARLSSFVRSWRGPPDAGWPVRFHGYDPTAALIVSAIVLAIWQFAQWLEILR